MAIVILWVNYSLFWPVQTLDIKNYSSAGMVQTEKTSYKLGEPISYVLDYCKGTDVPPTVSRELVDGQIIMLSDNSGYLPIGCHTTTVETAVIPNSIVPETYYLDVTVRYPINPFRTETVHYRTNSFQVTK